MFTKRIKTGSIAAALLCSVVVAEVVLAQGPGPRQPGAPNPNMRPMPGQMMQGGMMMRGQMGGADESLVAIASKELGVTQTDLVAALQGGKTIADIAKEKNVDLAKIVDAFVAEKVADRQAMVASGRWTQAQLDTMTAMVKANILQKLSQPFNVQGTCGGAGFVDQNGDGKCDNMPAMPMVRRGPNR